MSTSSCKSSAMFILVSYDHDIILVVISLVFNSITQFCYCLQNYVLAITIDTFIIYSTQQQQRQQQQQQNRFQQGCFFGNTLLSSPNIRSEVSVTLSEILRAYVRYVLATSVLMNSVSNVLNNMADLESVVYQN